MGRVFKVSERVEAGQEIFLDYGYCSRGYRGNPDWAGMLFAAFDESVYPL
jgi:hypothetical protein